jgi:hypothetical protein
MFLRGVYVFRKLVNGENKTNRQDGCCKPSPNGTNKKKTELIKVANQILMGQI